MKTVSKKVGKAGGRKAVKPEPKEDKPDKLTPKELLFALAYTGEARFNGTEAARSAGYAGDENVLGVQASRLLRKARVSEFIESRLAAAKMTSDEVLMELADIGKAEWREFVEVKFDRDGKPLDAKLRLADKIKALELLGKHHKLFDRAGEETPDLSKLSNEEIIQLAAIRAKLNS